MTHQYRPASLALAILLSLIVATGGYAQDQPRDAFTSLETRLARLESSAGSAIDGRSLARAHKELLSLRNSLAGLDGDALRDARRRLARLSLRLRDLSQRGATSTSVTAAAGTGGISGVVTADGGTPLANVVVVAFLINHPMVRTTTDSAGRYLIAGLVPGGHKVFTSNSHGFLDELYKDTPCALGACDLFSQGTAVAVTDGQTTSGIDFALSPGGRVTGRVTDAATGAPVAGAEVDISYSDDFGFTTAVADTDGRFVSGPGLSTGTYRASAAGPGYMSELFDDISCSPGEGCDFSSGTPIAVVAGAVTSGIDFALDKGGSISGRVIGSDTGAGIAGVYVYFFGTELPAGGQGFTDADGRYRSFDGLPTGTYWVRVFAGDAGYLDEGYDNIPCDNRCSVPLGSTPVAVTIGQDTPGIDFTLDRGGVITGRVTDGNTGQPLANLAVEAVTTTRIPFWDNFGITDESGVYRILALGTGTYRAAVESRDEYLGEVWQELECSQRDCASLPGTPIAVQAGLTVAGIDFTPVRGGTITGRVVDHQTNAPLAAIHISVFDVTGRNVFFSSFETAADGSYEVVGLPTGSFFLLAREDNFPRTTYVDELYGGVACLGEECDVTQGRAVRVTVGDETSGIDFRLDKGGRIAGRVTDALTGEPIAFAQVSIYDAVTVRYLETVFTDDSGRYASGPKLLAKGQYLVTAAALGYRQELYDDIPCEGGCNGRPGTRVKVTPPAITTGIDFALDPVLTSAVVRFTPR